MLYCLYEKAQREKNIVILESNYFQIINIYQQI